VTEHTRFKVIEVVSAGYIRLIKVEDETDE
jgi:hypothetical protein